MLDIAVNVADAAAWTPGVEYAAGLAARLEAALTGLHVPPAHSLLASLPEDVRLVPADVAAAERRIFRDRARERGVRRAAWQVVEGYLPDVLAHVSDWLDLVVLERDPAAAWGSAEKIGHLVLASGGACLVVPDGWSQQARVERVLIGWNGSPEAIRAVRAALPLLRRARHVVVLSGAVRDPYMANWDPPFDLAAYLSRHAVDHHILPCQPDARAGRALLEQAEKQDADLLVMGAYGRSRFSEWMFGGATREVLQDARLPVLMKR